MAWKLAEALLYGNLIVFTHEFLGPNYIQMTGGLSLPGDHPEAVERGPQVTSILRTDSPHLYGESSRPEDSVLD